VVVLGDRGLVMSARIREDLEPAGLDWMWSSAVKPDARPHFLFATN